MTAQASTEKSEEKRRVVGRPFRKGRDPRRNAGAKKAEPEQPQDVRAWAKSVIDDPKVRAQVKRMAQRGELSAPLLKNLMERAAGIVKDAAQPQGESERDREARELAAGMRRNLSQDERLAMYSLLRKARGEDWKDGFEAVRRAQAGRARPPVEAPYLVLVQDAEPGARPALPEPQEPEQRVIDLVPEASPRDWREEREWRKHLVRCSDPRSCNDSGRPHPSHAWRRLARL